MITAFSWEWAVFWKHMPDLLWALWLTVRVTVGGSAIALVLGWFWVLVRRAPFGPARWVGWAALEFVRDTPPIVHLLVVFYALPGYGVTWSPFVVGVLVLGVHYSTFVAEIYRGGLAAIPPGQLEAAQVLGLSKARTWSSVVLPQVMREAAPALANSVLALFKETSLLVVISLPVLMTVAQRAGVEAFRYLEPLTAAAILYLIVTVPFGLSLRRLERRYASRRH